MKILFWGIIFLSFLGISAFLSQPPDNQWNPDAGVVPSYTESATLFTSSNTSQSIKIIDHEENTAWQSDAPLPHGFVTRPDLNLFLNKKAFLINGENFSRPKNLTDGNLNTVARIKKEGGRASLVYKFEKTTSLVVLSIKCQTNARIDLFGKNPDGEKVNIGTYHPDENYQFKRFENIPGQISELILSSTSTFDIFEIAGMSELPKEYVVIDFGKTQTVGTVYSKHWPGSEAVETTSLYLSMDEENWEKVANLNPNTVFSTINNIKPELNARFLKLEHSLFLKDWNKVSIWEIKAYDKNGHYGKRPVAEPSHVSLSELLGVNGYWGWGRKTYSDRFKKDEGPALYAPISSHARNYHDLTWDLNDPDDPIDFDQMANGRGTSAKEWLDWDKEYKEWIKTGMNIQASIQFFRFDQTEWDWPFESAYRYGRAYAEHFGGTHGNGYICSMEVGNEPWKYEAPIYRKILSGMAKGAKTADPKMEVFPCALQAADPDMEKSGIFKNYIGARIPKVAIPFLDGINIHVYSYRMNFLGRRVGVYPEHSNSSFWEILNAIRWRNHNMPGKKIYLSEWGWDADGGGEDCVHNECVSEQAAAAYAVRSALISQRLGLDRATWYFFANSEEPSSLYTRSGLTGSAKKDFKKKMVFYALERLVKSIGEAYFLKVIREDDEAWIYLLGTPKNKATHLVAWRPVSGDDSKTNLISWQTNLKPKSVLRVDGKKVKMPVWKDGKMIFEIGAMPVVVGLE